MSAPAVSPSCVFGAPLVALAALALLTALPNSAAHVPSLSTTLPSQPPPQQQLQQQSDNESRRPIPVVMWHGMGDSCCLPFSLGSVKKLLEKEIPGVYVLSLQFGDNVVADTWHGFFGSVNDQVLEACRQISADPLLQQGYNAIGFSQGAQFLRAVAERCPSPGMRNLISLGGQHQGVFGIPHCYADRALCENMRRLLDLGAYESFVQSHSVQAQYWRDPTQLDKFRNASIFLADINNERPVKNSSYATNLRRLRRLVLVMFANDSMVVPRQSSHFGYYAAGQDRAVLAMQYTPLYQQDWIGLKWLDREGRLVLLTAAGDHLQLSQRWLIDHIVTPYLV